MAKRKKLFRSGGTQAARSPKEYRFDRQREVLVYRQGGEWGEDFLQLAGTALDFPYRQDRRNSERGPDFD